jgi:hypothetical protein
MGISVSSGASQSLLGGTPFSTLFAGGVIDIYSGTAPVTADDAVTGQLLGRVTLNGGAFTEGSLTNGLSFTASGPSIIKTPGVVWSLTGILTGYASWWRLRGNAIDSGGFSLAAPRIDGSIGLSNDPLATLTFINLLVESGFKRDISNFTFRL